MRCYYRFLIPVMILMAALIPLEENYIYSQQPIHSFRGNYPAPEDSARVAELLDSAWVNRSNNPSVSIKFALEGIKTAESYDDQWSQAQGLGYLSVAYNNLGAYQLAMNTITKCLAAGEQIGDTVIIAYAYNTRGDIYTSLEQFPEAIESIGKAIVLFNKIGHKRGLAYTEILLGRVYLKQGNYKDGLAYFQKALSRSIEIPDSTMYARILLDIAKLRLETGEYEEALKNYSHLNELYTLSNYKKGLAETLSGMARVYLKAGDYKSASSSAVKSLQIHRSIPNQEGEISQLILLSSIYTTANNLTLAAEYLDSSLQLIRPSGSLALLKDAYEARYRLYEKSGDFRKAFAYLKEYDTVEDSLAILKQRSKFVDLDNFVALERTELANKQLEKELEDRNFLLTIYIVISFILVALTALFIYRYQEKKRLSAELEKINDIKNKFFNIIAHDLKSPFQGMIGTLEILKNEYFEMTDRERREIIDMFANSTTSIYTLLDNLLTWSRSQQGYIKFQPKKQPLYPLVQEIRILQENALKNKNMRLHLSVPAGMMVFADTDMLKAIIRNLLSNAVKFAYLDGEIKLTAQQTGTFHTVTVEDTGPGINQELIPFLFSHHQKVVGHDSAGVKSSGLGLIICHDFVTAHGGTISVESEEEKYTRVKFTLPVKE